MDITHLGHSCVLIETSAGRILIDPGGFSDDFSGLRDLDLIIITHQHPDHLDVSRLGPLMAANPRARVFSDPESLEVLAAAGIDAQGHPVTGSCVGNLRIDPVGHTHALIHEELPQVTNVGVRLSAPGEPTLYHPGDCLDADPGPVDVLAFPLNAPWQRSREMTAFLRRVAAPVAFPIHDRLLSRAGRDLYLGQAARLGNAATELRDLAGLGRISLN